MLHITVRPEELFSALSDETRLRILCLLFEGELCIRDLMALMASPQSTLSRHMGRLRRAGLVQDRRNGKWVHYSLAKETFPRELLSLISSFKRLPIYESDRKKLNAHLTAKKGSAC